MRLLGIDWGQSKIGLALAEADLAVPLVVIPASEAPEKIKRIAEEERIDKVVVGVSESKMADEAREFGKVLAEQINLPVEFSDETLTTREAIAKAAEAGVPLKKRQEMEDAFAATLMLQNYLDSR